MIAPQRSRNRQQDDAQSIAPHAYSTQIAPEHVPMAIPMSSGATMESTPEDGIGARRGEAQARFRAQVQTVRVSYQRADGGGAITADPRLAADMHSGSGSGSGSAPDAFAAPSAPPAPSSVLETRAIDGLSEIAGADARTCEDGNGNEGGVEAEYQFEVEADTQSVGTDISTGTGVSAHTDASSGRANQLSAAQQQQLAQEQGRDMLRRQLAVDAESREPLAEPGTGAVVASAAEGTLHHDNQLQHDNRLRLIAQQRWQIQQEHERDRRHGQASSLRTRVQRGLVLLQDVLQDVGGPNVPADHEPPPVYKRRLHRWDVRLAAEIVTEAESRAHPGGQVRAGAQKYVAHTSAGPETVGPFLVQRDAQRAAEHCSPPVWVSSDTSRNCMCCGLPYQASFVSLGRRHHCRNCGIVVCGPCSRYTWPRRMVPALYNRNGSGAYAPKQSTVRVCNSCHRSMQAFRCALLDGDEAHARTIHEMGNVNLTTPFLLHKDGRLPVHCAAQGGSLRLLRWLVEEKHCPLVQNGAPLTTASGETTLSIAAAGNTDGHLDVLYWAANCYGASTDEIRSRAVATAALGRYIRCAAPPGLTQGHGLSLVGAECGGSNAGTGPPQAIPVADSGTIRVLRTEPEPQLQNESAAGE